MRSGVFTEPHPVQKPTASYQLTQQKLVDMMLEIEMGTLLALHLGRMKDEGTVRPEPISVGKLGRVGGPVRRIRYTGFREILFYELL